MGKFAPNPAQIEALAKFKTGESLRITAAAGSGKTSTLEYLAAQTLDKRILYIAFNKSVQLEAAERFPSNVTAKTAHSLAYAQFGRALSNRLGNAPRLTSAQVAQILGQREPFILEHLAFEDEDTVFSAGQMGSMALNTMSRFMRSDAETVQGWHFKVPDGTEDLPGLPLLRKRVVEMAQAAWEDVSKPQGLLRCTHDVYLKLWAMSQPYLGWDVIMVDEAQDTDPLLAQVVKGQMNHAQIVVVGDEAQSIYGWRGATRFISDFPAKNTVELAQSFRFGQAVADEANVWLDHVGTELRVIGNPAKSSRIETLDAPDAILCRSNAGALAAVMRCISQRQSVALVGGAKDLERFVKAAERLIDGLRTDHPDLIAFPDWDEVQRYVKTDEGADLAVWVKLIDQYGPRALLAAISSTVREEDAEVVVSTAHKAKGRQWPKVLIWNDFREPKVDPATGKREPVRRDEAMLAYVAVTRAEEVLDNLGLAWVHALDDELALAS